MRYIVLSKNEVKEILFDIIYSCRTKAEEVENAKYHHNRSYKNTPNALLYGILSISQLAKIEGKKLTREEKLKYNDDYHVNGTDHVSLASVETDSDPKEIVYNPFSPTLTDISISNSVKAYRNSKNYANEYLVNDGISPNLFRAVDIRILKNFLDKNYASRNNTIQNVLEYYNCLRIIATTLVEQGLDIPLREMSAESLTLDPEKVMKQPIMVLKYF